ncbi:CoA transferase [Pseudoroseomonas wenyumeiae]|uniref:CoA transferase n=1 Tax=Teichococcus wenyumeiae TaxID=2478470 RepID=A0A3A9JAB3_9PROT|nr:CoA transferase [Pseudoroseomonas wenyumeiae]RKK04217.1 CoA transferase [Pseudoroseomonas wenyumeiae]RMI19251.1 CoA transferase [Pseudoroseomonas wenyumeiae]
MDLAPNQTAAVAPGTEARGPLAGFRILELGHYVAAPFATRLLGDLGAEVIKVEPPGGDPVRQWGARYKGSAPWWSVHARNKRCITLDLKKPGAREVVLDLVRTCDALVENHRPGQLAKMGLGEEVLRAAKPDLVIARVSGYGQDGPDRDKAAFGVIGEAIGGLRHLTNHAPGTTDLPPVRVGVSIGDSVAGIYAALGVVAALLRRERTGQGGEVDVALSESIFSLLEGALPEYGALGAVRQPSGGGIATAAPSNAYRSRDGVWVLIAANSEPLWRKLAALMGQPELAADPRFSGNQQRVAHVRELDGLINAWTVTLDAAALEAALRGADIPHTRVYTVADIAADPQMRARGMVQQVQDGMLGPILHPGVVPRVDGTPNAPRSTGPAVGADNDAVLGALPGYDAARIAALREEGVL